MKAEGIGVEERVKTLWIPLFSCSIISPLLYFNNNLKPTQHMQEIIQRKLFYPFFLVFQQTLLLPPKPTQQPPQTCTV